MKVEAVRLHRVRMPLRSPFRTSFGTETTRDVLLVEVDAGGVSGWGECVANAEPRYSSEYVDGAQDAMQRFLLPAVAAVPDLRPATLEPALRPFRGHRMAKAAVEAAVLDAYLREADQSLAQFLGSERDRVPAGVSVGIMDDVPQLLDAVQGYLDDGYLRIKLKIEPGWDVRPVRAVRERFGPDLLLQVDANAAYRLSDAPLLGRLDDLDLLLIEQPLDDDELLGHAELARRLRTPICLDETIVSASVAAQAIALGACRIINIKPGRVGGYLESRRIHDLARAHGVAVWAGGMLETGIGRAANLALAGLPGFVLPGDTSASDRYYRTDVTEPFVLREGHVDVPAGPGIGVDPLPDVLAEVTTRVTTWTP